MQPDAANVTLDRARRKRERKVAIAAFLNQLGIPVAPFRRARLGQVVTCHHVDGRGARATFRALAPRGPELN